MTPFLISLTGADRRLLEAHASHDVAKYAGVGGAVLTTAVFAVLSSTFALQMALDAPLPLALLFGLAWGLAILNLDRWLVAANARQSRWWQNVLVALPRVLMALVIGVVMSTPFVLRLFQAEIDQELVLMQQQAQAQFEQDLREDPRFADLPERKAEIVALQESIASGTADDVVLAHPEVRDASERLDAVAAEHDAAEQAVACEKEGSCGSGRAGAGPAYEEKLQRRDRLAAERATLMEALATLTERVRAEAEVEGTARRAAEQERLTALQQEVQDAERARDQEVAAQAATSRSADGLLARIEALERVSKKNETLHLAHLVLLVFLTTIECLPVLVKLFQSFGKPTRYEVLVQQEDFEVLEARRQSLQRTADEREIDDALQLDKKEFQARADLEAEAELARRSNEARLRLATIMLQRWEADQRRDLERSDDALPASAM